MGWETDYDLDAYNLSVRNRNKSAKDLEREHRKRVSKPCD